MRDEASWPRGHPDQGVRSTNAAAFPSLGQIACRPRETAASDGLSAGACRVPRLAHGPLHGARRDLHRRPRPVALEHPRFLGLELEIVGEQILHAVALFGYTDRTVPRGVGEDMVELMGQYAAQRTPVFRFPILYPECQQSGLH